MSEINTIIKIVQGLIPKLLKRFDLDEEQVSQFMAQYLEDSDQFQDLLSKISKMNFQNDTNSSE